MWTKLPKVKHGLAIISPFVGSKRKLAPTIIPLLPPHKTYLEAFGGGAALFFLKPEAERTILNDADPALVKFYRDFSCAKLEDCKKIKSVCAFAKKARERVRKGSGDVCDQIAARRFSIVSDITGGMKTKECKLNPIVTKRLEKRCPEYEGRLNRAKITNLDFKDVFKRYDSPDTLTFMDPPYPGTTIQPYAKVSKDVTPEEVCALARNAKGHVLVTYNDIPEVRSACHGLHMRSVPSSHVSHNVTKGRVGTRELLIANFPI